MDPSVDIGSNASASTRGKQWAFWEKLYLTDDARGAGFRGFRGGIGLASDF